MLRNKTTGKAIIQKVRFARTFFAKLKGLMFKREFDFALVFEFSQESMLKASIHMCFVFTPIDAVYLNAKKEVVDLKAGLKPWTLNYTPKKPAKYLVELPAGTVKSKKIKLKEKLGWS